MTTYEALQLIIGFTIMILTLLSFVVNLLNKRK